MAASYGFRPDGERRALWLRDRAGAQTLRTAFPSVMCVNITLEFDDASTRPPASQWHVMHPPARAFFQFLCPFSDCSGKFDLGPVAASVMTAAVRSAKGTLQCSGERHRNAAGKSACAVRMKYVITAQRTECG